MTEGNNGQGFDETRAVNSDPLSLVTIDENWFTEHNISKEIMDKVPELQGRVRPEAYINRFLKDSTDVDPILLEIQLKQIATLPQTRLLEAVYQDQQQVSNAVPLDVESELIQAVNDNLAKLDEREREMIEDIYGLKTWVPTDRAGIAKKMKLDFRRVDQIHNRIIYRLRNRARFPSLKGYLAYPYNSIANKRLGMALYRNRSEEYNFNQFNVVPIALLERLRELKIVEGDGYLNYEEFINADESKFDSDKGLIEEVIAYMKV